MLAYDEPAECYYYLEIISKSARTKRKPIEEILTDTLVSPEMRKKAEKAIYRSYIATDGVHVKTTRQTLAKHFVKTRCKSLTKYDDFVREYNLWLGCLDVYYFDGVYSITSDNLPPIQFERMKDVLTDVFYTISDVKRLFLREFPDADTSSINPYTLKTLGFRVYSGYVVKNTYPSAVDYFRELLTTEDVVNAKALSRSVLNVVAYSSELYRLRSNYEIVEYAPLQYINIRRLNAAGITVEHFKKYCSDVAAYHEKGEYFTVKSMHQRAF